MLEEARNWRMAGSTARLLLALRRPLRREAPLFLPGERMAGAAFRHGRMPDAPPLLLDPVSRRDPMLAPEGAATATVTLGAVPHRLFDGGWTPEKRTALAAHALARIEKAIPGTLPLLASVKILVPPDMESGLAANVRENISEVGNAIAEKSGTFSLTFFIEDDMAICSLRSIGDYDVTPIALKFGGGGHKNAAGFKMWTPQFLAEVWE